MKYLTPKEFSKAPAKIQWLYTMALAKQPIGSSTLENAIKEHPEYFPDELEHRRKYDLIPQQVHDDYWKEWRVLIDEMYKEMPPSKGILSCIDDPKGYKEWSIAYEKAKKKQEPLQKALHDKFYHQYGIEWNGI